MSLRVDPAAQLRGELRLPGDKSISHRAILFAALAHGETLVAGAGDGHDVRSTAGIVRALGATCDRLPTEADDAPGTARWRIVSAGRHGLSARRDGALDCGNSGTSARLGAGLVAGVAGTHLLDGDGSLRRRPMTRVLEPLRAMGIEASGADGERGETAPMRIVGGTPHGTEWRPATPSAQVKSCVLIAGLAARGTTTYIETVATRDHSERMLAARGAKISRERRPDGAWATSIAGDADGSRSLTAIPHVRVPGDPSSAAFWLVAASLHPDADLTIRGVSLNPTRRHVIDLLRRMGASIDETMARGEQSLLFLNRRGYAPVLACSDCGWKSECPHCSAYRVFHKSDRTLIHGVLMLVADAGFLATALTRPNSRSAEGLQIYTPKKNQHLTIAYASISVASLGYLLMLFR